MVVFEQFGRIVNSFRTRTPSWRRMSFSNHIIHLKITTFYVPTPKTHELIDCKARAGAIQ